MLNKNESRIFVIAFFLTKTFFNTSEENIFPVFLKYSSAGCLSAL